MPTTGSELFRIYQQEIDESYTGYYDAIKANRLFKQAYIATIQAIYLDRLNNQNAFDQLSYLLSLDTVVPVISLNTVYHTPIPITSVTYVGNVITYNTEFPHQLTAITSTVTVSGVTGTLTITTVNVTNAIVTAILSATSFQVVIAAPPTGVADPNTGTITYNGMLSNYMHWLWGKARFVTPFVVNYTAVTITNSTNSSPIRITLNKRTKLRTGDSITITGITGNTAANGTRFVKQYTDFEYALYSDQDLLIPVTGNGVHAGLAVVNIVTYNTVKQKRSDEKGSVYGKPTPDDPRFQQGELSFQFYPKESDCTEITVDYIRKMPREIDVADNIIDYERWYPAYFLEKIASEAGRSFAMSSRDGSLLNVTTEATLENP